MVEFPRKYLYSQNPLGYQLMRELEEFSGNIKQDLGRGLERQTERELQPEPQKIQPAPSDLPLRFPTLGQGKSETTVPTETPAQEDRVSESVGSGPHPDGEIPCMLFLSAR